MEPVSVTPSAVTAEDEEYITYTRVDSVAEVDEGDGPHPSPPAVKSVSQQIWRSGGYEVSADFIRFLALFFFICIISSAAVYNITAVPGSNTGFWASLISICVGVFIPTPGMRSAPIKRFAPSNVVHG